jgi:hypothetical protein
MKQIESLEWRVSWFGVEGDGTAVNKMMQHQQNHLRNKRSAPGARNIGGQLLAGGAGADVDWQHVTR